MLNFWETLPKPILALAPMAGITDSSFRLICKELGADVVYSEMISADGLHYDSRKTLDLLKFNKKELPLVIQLFGKRLEIFPKACQIVEKAGVSGVDINFGCPAMKVAAHGGGVTLMRDLDKCFEIVKTVCESTKLPVSVKIRALINKTQGGKITALDFIKKIKKLPVKAIMIHGRSYEQGFQGQIDFRMIKEAKKLVGNKIIILANGGVKTPADALEMLEKTKADGLGIAQGLLGKPWLFKQIKDFLTRRKYQELSQTQIKKLALKQAKYAYQAKGDRGILEMRKHLAWYVRGWPEAAKLRAKLVRVESLAELQNHFFLL